MKRRRHWVGSVVLPVIVLLMGVGLAAWKYDAIQAGQAASASQPEPMETVTVALVRQYAHAVYGKQMTRTPRVKARDEMGAKAGDTVRVVETRPLAKTVRWRVVEIVERAR